MGKQGPCNHCGIAYTPLWRNGPPEKPVLCNACGSRWRTRGTLENYMPLHAGGLGLCHPQPGGSKARATGPGGGAAGRRNNKAAAASGSAEGGASGGDAPRSLSPARRLAGGSLPSALPPAAKAKQSTRSRVPGRRRGGPTTPRPGALRLGGSKGVRTLRPGPYQRASGPPLSAAGSSSSSAGTSLGLPEGEGRRGWRRTGPAGGGVGGAGLLSDEDEGAEGEGGEEEGFDDEMEDVEEEGEEEGAEEDVEEEEEEDDEEGEEDEEEDEEEEEEEGDEGDEEEDVGPEEGLPKGQARGQRYGSARKANALRPEAGPGTSGLQGARRSRGVPAAAGPGGKGIRRVRGHRGGAAGAGSAWGGASRGGRVVGGAGWGLAADAGAGELEMELDLDLDLGLGLGLEAADIDLAADWDALLGEMKMSAPPAHPRRPGGGQPRAQGREGQGEEEGEEEGAEEEEDEEEDEDADGEDEDGSEGEEGARGEGDSGGELDAAGAEEPGAFHKDHGGACQRVAQGTRGLVSGTASGLPRTQGGVWARSMSEADLSSLATSAWGRSSLLASLAQGSEAPGRPGKVRRRGLPPAAMAEDRGCAVGGGGQQGLSGVPALARTHPHSAASCCSPLRAGREQFAGAGAKARGHQAPGLLGAEAVGCSSSSHLHPGEHVRHLPGLPRKVAPRMGEGAEAGGGGVGAGPGAECAEEELLAQEELAALPAHGGHSVRSVWRAGGEWWGPGGEGARLEAEELGSELGSDEDKAVGLLAPGHSQHRRRSRQLWEGEVAGAGVVGKGLPRAASAGDLCLPSVLTCSTESRSAAPSLGSASSSTLSALEHARKRGRVAPGQGPGQGPSSPPSWPAEAPCARCHQAEDAAPGAPRPGCPSCLPPEAEDEQGPAAEAPGPPAGLAGGGQAIAVEAAVKAERHAALHSSSSSCSSNGTNKSSLDYDAKPASSASAGAKGLEAGRISTSSSSSSAANSATPLAITATKKEKPHYNPRTVLKGVKSPLTRLNLKHIVNARVLSTLFPAQEDRALLRALLPAPDQDVLQGSDQGLGPAQGEEQGGGLLSKNVSLQGREPPGSEAARWHSVLGCAQVDAALLGFQRLLARGALDPSLFHPQLAAPLALLTTEASLRAPALVAVLDRLSKAGVPLRRRAPKARAPRQLPGLQGQGPEEAVGAPRVPAAPHPGLLPLGAAGAAAGAGAKEIGLQAGVRPGSKGSAAPLPPLHNGPLPPLPHLGKAAWPDSSGARSANVPGLVSLVPGPASQGGAEWRKRAQDVSPAGSAPGQHTLVLGAAAASHDDPAGSRAGSTPLPRAILDGPKPPPFSRAGPADVRALGSGTFSSCTAAPARNAPTAPKGTGGPPTSSSGARRGLASLGARAVAPGEGSAAGTPGSKSAKPQAALQFRLGDGGPCNNGSLIVTPSVHMFADPLHDSLMWDSAAGAAAADGENAMIVPLGATAPPHHFK